jgi:hypothetical protein
MSKELEKFIGGILTLVVLYYILAALAKAIWHGSLEILYSFGHWLNQHMIWVISLFLVASICPFVWSYLKRKQRVSVPKNSISDISKPTTIYEEDSQSATFSRWTGVEHDSTLKLTTEMILLMNEMLKSKRHRREYVFEYKQVLQSNGYGYVYFVKAPNGTTKIGLSSTQDPFKRISDIFGGVNTSYGDVEVIHLIRTNSPHSTEKAFHQYFTKKRYVNPHDPKEKSEFFILDEEDWIWIRRHEYPEWIQKTISA